MHKLALATLAVLAVVAARVPDAAAQSFVDRDPIARGDARSALTDVGYWRDPTTFTLRSRWEMDKVLRRVRDDVGRGRASPYALTAIAEQRNAVESMLTQAAADGRIGRAERHAINERVAAMRASATPLTAPWAYGGGPAAH